MTRTLVRTAAAVSVTLLLGGCALLRLVGGGGGDPAQLYQFHGGDAAAEAARPVTGTVQLTTLTFQDAAAGDRLLAVTSPEAFYIANSRWVSPAEDLFAQAAERAFGRAGVRLSRRGQPFDPDASLVMSVPAFEARYENGAKAAPVVVVQVRASMIGGPRREVVGETSFTARQPAAGNTVPQIVAAYDAATTQALDQVASWAATTLASVPKS